MNASASPTIQAHPPQTGAVRRAAPEGKRRRKTRPSPGAGRRWSVRYALGAYAATLVLDFVFAAVLTRRELRLGLGVFAIDLAMLATLVPLYRSSRFSPRDLGLRPTAPPRAIGLVCAAVVVYLVFALVWTLALIGPIHRSTVPQLGTGTGATVLTGFAMCVLAPVVEEVFFRGLLYRALRNRLGVMWSVLIVGVLFGAVHGSTYPLNTLPVKVAFGVIACLLYEWTGSLWPSIALHSLVDSSGYEASISHGSDLLVWLAFLLLAADLLLRHRLRAPTQHELRAVRGLPGQLPPGASPTTSRLTRRLRRGGPLSGLGDAIIARTGRSPRRLLACAGLVLIVAGVIVALADPHQGPHNSPVRLIIGFSEIGGLLCLISALFAKLSARRWPNRS